MGTKRILSALVGVILLAITSTAQEFVNINTKQLGEKINLEYAISGESLGQIFNVTPYFSLDAGKTFQPIKSATGNLGPNVPGGTNQIIIWDVLKDYSELDGDIMFKLTADTKTTLPTQEEFRQVNFKIESLHHVQGNRMELVLTITNNGPTRDLKMINGLITLTDFNKQKYDAQQGKIGEVVGSERYSTPTREIKNGEAVKAVFTFERVPDNIDRAMRLDLGVELITNEGYGIDLKIGKVQFRDLPITFAQTAGLKVEVAKKFEAVTSPSHFTVRKPVEIKDTKAPDIALTQPANVPLVGSEATRGRPYAQSSIGMDDKRLRALASGEEFATTDKSIVIKGKATDESGIYEVVINGVDAKLYSDGTFEADVPLAVGKNEIAIRAVDLWKNSVEKKFFVLRKADQGQVAKGETEELDIIFDEQKRPPRYFALIMGANDYQDENVSDLEQPINDATKLYNVLVSRYTFDPKNVAFIKNPTREQMINVLDYFAKNMTKNDNLLVFYAGHGFWDKDTDFGYWIPVDSKMTSTANWMANSQIKDYVAAIKTKHTLLIADACFGGSIFRSRKAFEEGSSPKNKSYDSPSRKAMTSGNLTEVPDRSVFLEYLVKRLNENTKDYISAEEIFGSMRNEILNSSPVTPMYGEIKDAGDEGGDFIFVRK